ncbi:BatA domain-containing protein [Pseudohongiella spirulinae]|uniref:VWFA domain-containing protein n=1 Tax=Pseudohongiella spirulinae TaxID=1249552 RepID=A0A0S2KBM9_9GAMM|nr:BatA domain-containing protein [Pseudohongiella spirulinae]ALO45704.1 hypothetical protein PS2015_1039 [Pseudohongiella spirulinae]
MSFLSPLFLLGLLAAAIPVAIHLIRRENPPKVMFGSLRFLKQTTKKLILFQQIQQWLLLALRALLICLLVFAFARPFLYQGSLARLVDAEPESVVILLDTSLSMHYADRFDRARDQVLTVLNALSPADEAALVTFAGATQNVRELTSEIDSLRSFVESLESPGYDRVRFFPPLQLANDLLAQASHERRRIVLVSDFQAAGMSDALQGWMLAPGVALQGISVADERSNNLSITDVRVPEQLTAIDADQSVLVRVRSTGTVFQDRGTLTLRLNGQTVEQQPVVLQDSAEQVVTLPLALDGSGQYQGELILAGDSFDLDNRWHFSLDVMPRMQVLIVNGAPSADWYDDEAHWFSLALQGMDSSPFEVTTVQAATLTAGLISEHDAVVLLNVDEVPQSSLSALQRFVEDGGSLWFAPGDRVDAQLFNQNFSSLSPARLLTSSVLTANDYRLIADMDRRHPALSGLDVDWSTRFEGFWQTEPALDSEVLIRLDSGEPLLLEQPMASGRSMLLSSSLDLGWSNFPLQGLYLPFVHEVLTYLIQPPQRQQSWQVGDVIALDSFFDASDERAVQLREPDGREVNVTRESPFYTARMPGVVSGPDSMMFSVNIAPDAATLAAIDVAELSDAVLNPETTPVISERVRTAQLIADIEQPQRLWWWILLLVVVVLLLEGWIANRTYR